MATIDALHMSDFDIASACKAWQMGGSMALGLWLSHYKPHFTVNDYGALVELVRAELGDATDYEATLEALK